MSVGVLVIVGGALTLSRLGAATQSPTPTSVAQGSASPSPLASATPGGPLAGTTALPRGGVLDAGVTYSPTRFEPPFTLAGRAGWTVTVEGDTPGYVRFVLPDPKAPAGAVAADIQVMRPSTFLPSGGGDPQPIPADFLAWVRSRADLELGAATPLNVGGYAGTSFVGNVRPEAPRNAGGDVTLLCAQESGAGCTWDGSSRALTVNAADSFELIVLSVRGDLVVGAAAAPRSTWNNELLAIDQFLAGLTFVPGG